MSQSLLVQWFIALILIVCSRGTETTQLRFPEALSPRTKNHPLLNKFEVTFSCANCHADFHVAAFYRSERSCELRIRRLDETSWDFDVHIRLLSLVSADTNHVANASLSEIHTVSPSPKSSFVTVMLLTKIKLQAVTELELYSKQNIPRIIMQTYHTTNATNIYHWNAFQTFVELNPEYEVLLMLDVHCRVFITKHFPPDVLNAYDTLVPKAYKADLFRYCFLYVKGGCYFDNKMINRTPLRRTIQPTDDFLVCSDSLPYGVAAKTLKEAKRYYNAVICSAPRDIRMLKAIQYVVSMVHSRSYGFSDLDISGPVAFYEATKDLSTESNLRFAHELGRHPFKSVWFPEGHGMTESGAREYRDYFVKEKTNNEMILTKFFKGYYSSAYRRYGDLWKQGKVFYETLYLSWRSYRLFVEPGILPYHKVSLSKDGIITVERRSIINTFPIAVLDETFKSSIRKYILLAGMGGLTDKIELKLLNMDSSVEYYLGLEVPTKSHPKTLYNIGERLHLHP